MDFKKLLLKIENDIKNDIPFVIYRKPESGQINILYQKDKNLNILKKYDESGFVFAPFDDNKETIFFSLENCNFKTVDIDLFERDIIEKPITKRTIHEDNSSKPRHISLIKKGIRFIQKNNVSKVVLSRKEEVEIYDFDVSLVLKKLLKSNPSAFVYIWFHPMVGLWVGATPEILINVKNDQFKTMSLAGTKSYTGTLDVKWGEKEKHEQQIVTEYILAELAHKKLNFTQPVTVKAGNIIHICTEISGKLKVNEQIGSIINKLHPTPAVCGLPKRIAKEFILKNEEYDREYYTGFLGELNLNKSTNLYVNLRCMQIIKNKSILYVGGGITTDSIPENEWEETVVKSTTMKQVLF
jgi:isochorismate synthase